jgi:cytidine deaminase
MSNDEMIAQAAALLRPYQTEQGRLLGDVGAVVLSASGKAYGGVCVDTASWGLCAERSAMAAMITDGEYRFAKVVTVWRDPGANALTVLPPCGVCREFMRQVDGANLAAEIVLGRKESVTLASLLPAHEWPAPLGVD